MGPWSKRSGSPTHPRDPSADGSTGWRGVTIHLGDAAVVEPLVAQCTAEFEFDCGRYRFVASNAARDAANAVQGEVPAEAGVASEYGHERRCGHIPASAAARVCGKRIVS